MAQDPLSFRTMQAADLESVARLARRAEPFGWTLGNFQDALASGYRCTVAESDGVIVGYSVVSHVLDECELLEIAIDPPFQGRGFGKRLLEWTMRDAASGCAVLMRLEVREGNARARGMYAKHGFAQDGIRRNYYRTESGRENAVLMTAHL